MALRLIRVIGLWLLVSLTPLSARSTPRADQPDLVLFLVIDQFRSDYLSRFYDQLSTKSGGLRFLMQKSAYFPNAEYDHLQCMTAAGHASMVTGAGPARHGVILNRWPTADRSQIEEFKMDDLVGTTLADELRFAYPQSLTVGVAPKNRAAQILGGKRAHLTLAFDSKQWAWVQGGTQPLPDAKLEPLQAPIRALKGQPITWLSHVVSNGTRDSTAFPQMLNWTTDAALFAAKELKLGERGVTDWLGVSYSSFDYAGHLYDTQSAEMKEQVIAVDQAIQRLVSTLQNRLRNRKLWIVLTADHGVAPSTESMQAQGIRSGRIDQDALRDRINAAIGEPKNAIVQVVDFHFYFSPEIRKLPVEEQIAIEAKAKAELQNTPGISRAWSARDIQERKIPGGLLEKQILNSYFPGRSGDLFGLVDPYYINGRYEPISHVTGYSYDRRVPLLIFAPGKVIAGERLETVSMMDLAPSLAALLQITPPPVSQGRVLHGLVPSPGRNSASP